MHVFKIHAYIVMLLHLWFLRLKHCNTYSDVVFYPEPSVCVFAAAQTAESYFPEISDVAVLSEHLLLIR